MMEFIQFLQRDEDEETLIIPIKLPIFDDNIPIIFSSYFKSKFKLGKSAKSRIEIEEPEPKKRKLKKSNEE